MRKKNRKELDYTLKFIDNVKQGKLSSIPIDKTPISPRMDEPTIYGDECDEGTLISFCN